MKHAGFPTNEENRSLPRWISALLAVGAITVAMIGTVTVTSGTAVKSEAAASGTSISTTKSVERSGTLLAHRVVY